MGKNDTANLVKELETVSPAGLRARAEMIREKNLINDSGSTARHLELAAAALESTQARVDKLEAELAEAKRERDEARGIMPSKVWNEIFEAPANFLTGHGKHYYANHQIVREAHQRAKEQCPLAADVIMAQAFFQAVASEREEIAWKQVLDERARAESAESSLAAAKERVKELEGQAAKDDAATDQILRERDAAEEAMQWLDQQLGGDGEYYFNTAEPDDCPCDPAAMARLIVERMKNRRDEVLEEAAKIADGWLEQWVDVKITHVPPHAYAADAIRDLRDGIRALKTAGKE